MTVTEVVVGCDETRSSRAALDWAVRARRLQPPLCIVHSMSDCSPLVGPGCGQARARSG